MVPNVVKWDFFDEFSNTVHRIFPPGGMHQCVSYTQEPIAIKSIFGKFWSISDVLAREQYLFMLKIILQPSLDSESTSRVNQVRLENPSNF